MSKKDIGTSLALYPSLIVVIGAMKEDKPNYLLVGHLGILGHDHYIVSLSKTYYTNELIKENKSLSINLVDEEMLEKADYVGCVSGQKIDKSEVFNYEIGELHTPIITEAPVSIECRVEDIYETPGFENFILVPVHTFVADKVLNEKGKIDYQKLKPVLFEFPTYQYLKTGDVIDACMFTKKQTR